LTRCKVDWNDCDRLPRPEQPIVVGAGFENQRAQRDVSVLFTSDDKATQQYLSLVSPAYVLAVQNAGTYRRPPCRPQLVLLVHCGVKQRIYIAALVVC